MRALRDEEIVLEICPTSNLLTKALPDEEAVRETFRAFADNGVPFTIATDGPEMMGTHLRDEFDLLLSHRRAERGRARRRERASAPGVVRGGRAGRARPVGLEALERLSDRADVRDREVGRKLEQRFQGEAALVQARVRDRHARLVDDGVSVDEEVEVDGARPPARAFASCGRGGVPRRAGRP